MRWPIASQPDETYPRVRTLPFQWNGNGVLLRADPDSFVIVDGDQYFTCPYGLQSCKTSAESPYGVVVGSRVRPEQADP
jgi:hypothetical protein